MYYYRLISSMLKAVISSLGTGLYAVYKATGIVTTLNTSIFRVYNGDNVNDTSGNAQNGTNVGGITFTTGKIGNAFTFNGSGYVALPNNSLNLSDSGSNAYSISLWVKFTDNSGLPQGLLTNCMQSGSNSWGWMIWYWNNQIYLTRRAGTSTSYDLVTPSSPAISTNVDYNVVVTRKNGSTKLFINGLLVASDTSTVDTVYTTTHYPLIGARQTYATPVYEWYAKNGTKIDAVNVWNKELTANEVTALYNSSTGLEYPFSTAITIDSANDSLGNYNGTANGGLTYTAGKSGNAFTFNGTTAYVSLPDSFKLSDSGSNAYSISLWVNFLDTSGLPQGLLTNCMQSGSNSWGWMIWYYTNQITFTRRAGTSVSYDLSTPAAVIYTNTYYNIVVTRKNGSTKLYINGVLIASDTSTVDTVYNTTHYPMIGVRQSYSTPSYDWYAKNGTKVDEVNVWNREVTATEVTELYNAGTGKFYPY